MKVLITGASGGIGQAIAREFLKNGHTVIGLDVCGAPLSHERYTHVQADVTGALPSIDGVEILIHSAGVQNSGRDVEVNLVGAMRVTEQYAFQKQIKSVLFIASSSAQTGSEFPEYAASKGGVVAYMKNVALRLAPYHATANSLSPGGVTTKLNAPVMEDKGKWARIMAETLLEKWASAEEIAEFAYFMTAVNRSMTAQDVLVDNGEAAKAVFVW